MEKISSPLFFRMTRARAACLAVLAAVLCFFPAVEMRDMESGDETRVAGIAAEMTITGDYLVPKLNGEPFLEYPPLYYWCTAGAFHLFGRNDAAAKLPSCLASALCGLLLFFAASRMGAPPRAAFLGMVFLLSSAQFFGTARRCMTDPMLAFFVFLAFYGFWEMAGSRGKRWFTVGFLLWSFGLSGAVMTKGLVGLILPMSGVGIYLLAETIRERKVRRGDWLGAGGGILLALGITAIWYLFIYFRCGKELFHTVFYVNNIGRFSGSQGDHTRAFWYYFGQLPALFQPWLIFLLWAVYAAFRRLKRNGEKEDLYLLCILLVPFLLLSAAAGKRIVYLMPLYAPAAWLCARALSHGEELPERVRTIKFPPWAGKALWGVVLAGLLTECVLLTGYGRLYPLLGLVCGIAAAAGVLRPGIRLTAAVAAAALLLGSVEGIWAHRINSMDSVRSLYDACRKQEQLGRKTVLIRPAERTSGAAVFYLGHLVGAVKEPPERVPAGTCYIVRVRKGRSAGIPFGDHHYLLLPEQ